MSSISTPKKGLRERLQDGEMVVVAEGYILELERRGYLAAGPWIPLAVLDDPEVVRALHREFVHAGSDVVEAVTYFGHRTKLESIGRGDDYEPLVRNALRIAREVAAETGKLMAGSVCNTLSYTPGDEEAERIVRQMFKEQVIMSVEEGADYIIAETMFDYGEALLALQCIKEFGKGCPAVITLATTSSGVTFDGIPVPEACRKLEEAGADVVGLNCERGPKTMISLMKEIRKVCKGPLACLAVPLATDEHNVTMHSFKDADGTPVKAESLGLKPCSRYDIEDYGRELQKMGVQYVGLCCFNSGCLTRSLAESVGKTTPSSRYAVDLSVHVTNPSNFTDYQRRKYNTEVYS